MLRSSLLFVTVLLLAAILWVPPALAQSNTVQALQKISATEGGFAGNLDTSDRFGASVKPLGDFDGDGVDDLVVGASFQGPDVQYGTGAVWVLLLNADATVKSHIKISDNEGGFTGALRRFDYFGCSVAPLGDLDGDGITDLIVGAHGDGPTNSHTDRGAVWILFLNADGTVKAHQKIDEAEGDFTGTIDGGDNFGWSVAALGDLDGDGSPEVAVGATGDEDGGGRLHGAVWILSLNPNGTVKSHQKISATEGGFTGTLEGGDYFGRSVTSLGDFDRDGITDLGVGAAGDDDGGSSFGAIWLLRLNADGTVKSHQKISATQGGFAGTLGTDDLFGSSVTLLDDLDGDEVPEVAVGAIGDDDTGSGNSGDRNGAVWVLLLNADGTVKAHQKISATEGGFTGTLDNGTVFGSAVTSLGDFDGDGAPELVVGALGDNDGGYASGAVWVLDGPVAFDVLASSDAPSYPQGSLATVSYQACNNTSAPDMGLAFAEVFRDGNRVFGPRQVDTGAVQAETCRAEERFSLRVPLGAAPGTYEVVVSIGRELGTAVASDTVAVTVTPSAASSRLSGPAMWSLVATSSEAVAETEATSRSAALPTETELSPAYPNPFASEARIGFALPGATDVRLAVYDVLGREVAVLVNGEVEAGRHEVVLDGTDLPSGTYLVRLEVGTQTETQSLSLVR